MNPVELHPVNHVSDYSNILKASPYLTGLLAPRPGIIRELMVIIRLSTVVTSTCAVDCLLNSQLDQPPKA